MAESPTTQVLVVDDDQCVRLMMKTVLEDAGYCVLEARDGIEAMALLRTSLLHLVVLLDWMMPQMSGEDVLQAVKDGPAVLRRHAYILVTANTPTRSAHLLELLAELAVPVMPKPFRLQQLLDTVEEHDRRITTVRAVG